MLGLASAVEALHDRNIRQGDIKPQNILHFRGSTEDGEGILVLADVGVSRIHKEITLMRHFATSTREWTASYEAPEEESDRRKCMPRPRRYDMWSAGCTFLEFTVWLVYNYRAVRSFRKSRVTTDDKMMFGNFFARGPEGSVQIHPAVAEAVQHLRGHPLCGPDTALGDLITLIEDRLLQVQPEDRARAPEPCDRLEQIVYSAIGNAEYLCRQVDQPLAIPDFFNRSISRRNPSSDPAPSPPSEQIVDSGRNSPMAATGPDEVEQQQELDDALEPDLPEADETSSLVELEKQGVVDSPWTRFIAVLWYGLMTIVDPPPNGAQRVTYTCGCGDLQYLDVKELIPGGAAEFQQVIREAARAVQQHTQASNRACGTSAVLNAHSPLSISCNHQNQACSRPPSLESGTPRVSTANPETVTGNSPSPAITNGPKYLLICIDTKRGLAKLEHTDVSSITNDQFLFEEILRAYSSVRQEHEWGIGQLFPTQISFPSWLSNAVPITSLRSFALPAPFRGGRLFTPKRIEFVQFQLMPVRTEIYAGSMIKPDIPGEKEVRHKKTYEYNPFPLDVGVLQILAHELLKPGPHLNCFWRDRFPKKLKRMLLWDDQSDCRGWGIHITEDWNKPLATLLVLLVMVLFGLFVIIYGVLSKDWGTGATIGSFAVALFVLYCTLQYQWWVEQ